MERIDLFDRYIKGELSEEDNRKFKESLELDEDFASDFRIYSLSVIGICKEAEQDNADFGSAINRLQPRIVLNRAQRTELSGAAALNDTDEEDYREEESECAEEKTSETNKQKGSDNSLQRFTLIFIFIIILLIIISILM